MAGARACSFGRLSGVKVARWRGRRWEGHWTWTCSLAGGQTKRGFGIARLVRRRGGDSGEPGQRSKSSSLSVVSPTAQGLGKGDCEGNGRARCLGGGECMHIPDGVPFAPRAASMLRLFAAARGTIRPSVSTHYATRPSGCLLLISPVTCEQWQVAAAGGYCAIDGATAGAWRPWLH